MSKYKVGDKARVRIDLKVDTFYGSDSFVSGMKPWLGKTLTISTIVSEGHYFVKEDGHYWTDEMFEEHGPIKGDLDTINACIIIYLNRFKLDKSQLKKILSYVENSVGGIKP